MKIWVIEVLDPMTMENKVYLSDREIDKKTLQQKFPKCVITVREEKVVGLTHLLDYDICP